MEYTSPRESNQSDRDIDSDLETPPTSPPLHHLSLDSTTSFEPTQKTNEILIEKLIHSLLEQDIIIQQKIDALETFDITIQIISFKIYESTHEFKIKITEVKEERNKLLTSDQNKSELSLILLDLDKRICDLEKELDEKIKTFNLEKIHLQEQTEAIISQLDEDISLMQERLLDLKLELDVKKNTMYRAQVILINQKYTPMVDEFQKHLLTYKQLQLTGWRVENSEVKLSAILEEHGLQFTPSGRLLTRTGDHITFQDAQDKGYFKEVTVSLDRIFKFFKEHDRQQRIFEQLGTADSVGYSEGSTVDSKMSTEDVKYLKLYVGKPLTLALAEITAKQPRDPIHYLGHYLFKYRYNQELEEIQKNEIDELTHERKVLAEERWKKFVEDEARNAVIEMVLRAEEIAYQNELRRIEQEQMLAEEEEEGQEIEEMGELLEEARDKFE